jgi:protein transport protein SEC13
VGSLLDRHEQYDVLVNAQDCQVFIWTNDSESNGSSWSPKLLHKFNDVVWHLSWSVTGNILAVSGGDNKVSVYFL